MRGVRAAGPVFFVYYFLSPIVYVVNWGLQGFAVYVPESGEYWKISHSKIVDQLVIIREPILNFEDEFCLAKTSLRVALSSIQDKIIVVDWRIVTSSSQLIFIRSGANYILICFGLPNSSNVQLYVIDIIHISKSIFRPYSL